MMLRQQNLFAFASLHLFDIYTSQALPTLPHHNNPNKPRWTGPADTDAQTFSMLHVYWLKFILN